MELMKLEIVTPNGVIFDAEVKQVTLPGSEGEFGVLANHATLVSLLDTGVIVIDKADGSEVAVAINSGYVKVDEEKTTCIVDGAVALSGGSRVRYKPIDAGGPVTNTLSADNWPCTIDLACRNCSASPMALTRAVRCFMTSPSMRPSKVAAGVLSRGEKGKTWR